MLHNIIKVVFYKFSNGVGRFLWCVGVLNIDNQNIIIGDENTGPISTLLRWQIAVGHIKEFHPLVENIMIYLERLELYFTANGIADLKKADVLITSIGDKSWDCNSFFIYSSSTKH